MFRLSQTKIQVLGLAVARMIREGLYLVRPIHGRAPRGGVGRGAQRIHEHPDDAGAAPHVCVVVGGGMSRTRRFPSGSRSPPPTPADSTVAPDARASVRFLARGALSRSGCGTQSPAPPARGPAPVAGATLRPRRPGGWTAAPWLGAPVPLPALRGASGPRYGGHV